MYCPFSSLCLGAKFKYDSRKHGETDVIWVKISETLIARWDSNKMTHGTLGQTICSFAEEDTETLLKEQVELIK